MKLDTAANMLGAYLHMNARNGNSKRRAWALRDRKLQNKVYGDKRYEHYLLEIIIYMLFS